MKNYLFLFAALILTIAGCNNKGGHIHHEPADEEVKINLTAYNAHFEVFAEADPFVVGSASNVLSHFSHLPDVAAGEASFKAVEGGSINIRLLIGKNEVSQILEKPNRKGIYSFDIKPEVPGRGQLIYDIKTDKNSSELIVKDITVYINREEANKAAELAEPSRTNTVVFTKEQSWKIDFKTEIPLIEPFGQVIKTSAQVQSAQGDEVLISAKTTGLIIFTSDNIVEGKNMSRGQNIFKISGSGLAENNFTVRYTEARNTYERTKSDYERQRELAKDKIVSKKELLNAKNNFENAKAVYDNLTNNFSTTGQSVSSPISGFVKHVYVKNGQYIEAGQPIVSVSQNQRLMLKADVQQKYAPILGSIYSANIKTIHDSKTYSFEQLNGKVVSYGRNANNDNYLIPVSLQIDNKGSFIPGSYVETFLKTRTNTNALTIPNSSLMEDQGNLFVFVQIHPELFEKREIKIGPTDGLKTEVISGISKDERLVTRGAIFIKLGQASGTLDAHAGHNH